jgi:ubiquinone/menaquinone biosynthesis C-methylase UbiE
VEVFFEAHKDLPREGAGCDECTRKAYSLLPELPENPFILDIGCGPGLQTIQLAKISNGRIIASDNHQPFLNQLKARAKEEGVADRIETSNSSMFYLPFEKDSFDLVWSEGAIYIIGFEKGLRKWGKFLKEGGYLVVSELSWLTSNPPEEPKKFWEKGYPPMTTIEGNMETVRKAGYTPIVSLTIPESGWWDEYYTPLENRIALLRDKYSDDPDALAVLDDTQYEIDLYRKYSGSYGYVFYLMQKQATI